MLTRCPECATRFRVHEEQLRVAAGRVRCGYCGCLFDARFPFDPTPATPEHAAAKGVVARCQREPGTNTATDTTAAVTIPAAPPHSRPARWRKALGGAAALLLLSALALQGVWWQRHALAAQPQGLELVRLLCRIAPCHPRPPRAPERIEVLERELEPLPGQPGALLFHLRMVNRAPHPQPYPLLELRLLDARQRLAGVRRFTPAQYLTAAGDGILESGAGADVHLELIPPGEDISGFEFDFF